ncbi:hypothetical protein BGX38DRAFT_1221080 [Terfezia claveryi]|nr:hypothetical protein BGX38DRAFT_1221080 [Terfezia claveryi]
MHRLRTTSINIRHLGIFPSRWAALSLGDPKSNRWLSYLLPKPNTLPQPKHKTEERLGFMMQTFESEAVAVKDMLGKFKDDTLETGSGNLKTKEKVYDRIMEYLEAEGYPTEAEEDFKEANINDLVYGIISPIIADFRRKTGRNIRLRREKEIVAMDSETGACAEFILMDVITIKERNFVFIVEAKRSSIGEAMKQCLLAMRDMKGRNGGGVVFGFVTTGEDWRMIEYDGHTFQMTEKFTVLFNTMGKQKDRWMKENSVVVDCLHVALQNGGIVKKDVTEVA